MLTNESFTVNNLIQLTSDGLICADFTQVRAALIDKYRQIYGSDIDIDDTTADGVFLNNLSLIISNLLRTFELFYQNLDINKASGVYLDILCALSNVTRKQATKSNTILEIEYLGTDAVTYSPDDLIFVDKAGLEWKMTSNLSFTSANEKKSVYVECAESGAVTAPSGWINSTLEVSPLIGISQTSAANIGQETETDSALRTRQQTASGVGTTVIDGLTSALLNVPGIEDVYIKNEPDDTPIVDGAEVPKTLADGVKQKGHSIYIVLRQADGITIDDKTIADIIHSKLTPGISTTKAALSGSGSASGIAKDYEYIETVNGTSSSTIDSQHIYWKVAKPMSFAININIFVYDYFSTSEFDTIGKLMINYLNSLPIGYQVTDSEIIQKTVQFDPQFKGVATYSVRSVSFSSIINYLTYFNFSNIHYEFNQSQNSYILTIS